MTLRRIAPFITLTIVLAAWLLATRVFGAPAMLLPDPWITLRALVDALRSGELLTDALATLSAAAAGYAIGACTALLLAAAMALSRSAERALLVPLMAFQSIPKVALAPLIYLWVGFGARSSVTLVALACIYPVFANGLAGFRAVDGNLLDLYRVHGAGRWRTFLAVRLPAALPQLFVGLEVSVVFALLAAVVMELVAGERGLGVRIQAASATLDMVTVFGAVALLASIGIAASALLRLVRRRLVFWEQAPATVEATA
ncbi:MAG: ABC transporter permease subunit [Comamonadaceae bacterium]|nr:MAG: ABC transporter permease subunit [Comamonadaceae bacterium]